MSDIKGETYCYIWEFVVRSGSNTAFEKFYGADGDWVGLFRQSPGYLKTDLIRDRSNPQRYLTIDHWRRREDYCRFRRDFDADFEALDKLGENLTVEETKIGEFTRVDRR